MQTDTPLTGDQVRRFVLEQRPVRGHWAHLDNAWRELRPVFRCQLFGARDEGLKSHAVDEGYGAA